MEEAADIIFQRENRVFPRMQFVGFQVNIAGHGAGGPGSYWGMKDFSAAWRKGGHDWDVPGLEKYHGKDMLLTEALNRDAMEQMSRMLVFAHGKIQ